MNTYCVGGKVIPETKWMATITYLAKSFFYLCKMVFIAVVGIYVLFTGPVYFPIDILYVIGMVLWIIAEHNKMRCYNG
jgi:hypothetical protein